MKTQKNKIFAGMLFAIGLWGDVQAWAEARSAVRRVSSSSCNKITVKVGIGKTTQIVMEQIPKATLFADKKHFKIVTDSSSPRSLAIIPLIETADLRAFGIPESVLRSPTALPVALNKSFKTNLFVFFDQGNQLIFELQFAEKDSADDILKVSQLFDGKCDL